MARLRVLSAEERADPDLQAMGCLVCTSTARTSGRAT